MEELNNLRHYMLDLTSEYGTPHNNQKRNLWNAYYALEAKIKQLELTAVGCQREQLKAFFNWYDKSMYEGCSDDLIISEYLDSL
jgi:chemotaxis receptor (MCP) glutamine deamidase CheD